MAKFNEGNKTEEFRHQCEVRWLLRTGVTASVGSVSSFLNRVEKMRGKAARVRLETDYRDQWKKGNRGESWAWHNA